MGVNEVRRLKILEEENRKLKQLVADLRIKIRDLSQASVSYGYRRLHVLLQRDGLKVNHKRVYRI